MSVTVVGTTMSSPVDASGAFVLRGVPEGHVQLQFSANGTNAHLDLDDVADREDIHMTVNLNGGAAAIDDDDRETPDNRVEIQGRITAIDTTARVLQVAGKSVSVPAGTPIQHDGNTLALTDLRVGDRVEIHGTRNGTAIVATTINAETANPPAVTPPPGDDHGHDGDDKNEAEVKGALSARAGTCPSLTFNVGSVKVQTNAATTFDDTSCSALANGTEVEVKGARQADASILATRVEKEK
jgi:hypothetical protein